MTDRLALACVLLGGFAAPLAGQDELALSGAQVIEGEVEVTDEIVDAPELARVAGPTPVRGKTYRFVVEEAGPYRIDLSSYWFDAYLVVRDEAGNVVAEDQDGGLSAHARLWFESLESGQTYLVHACALHGLVGPFELEISCEPAPVLRREQELAALRADGKRGLEVVAARDGAESAAMARAHNLYGHQLYRQALYAEAQVQYESLLGLLEAEAHPNPLSVASVLNTLGRIAQAQGAYDVAEGYLSDSLEIRESELGPDDAQTSSSVNNLAALYKAMGRYDEARPLYERALAIREKLLGPDDPRTATCLNNLAMLLRAQGAHGEARPLYERALVIYETKQGEKHKNTATCLNNLATLLFEIGEHDTARPLVERARAIFEEIDGPEHPSTAMCMHIEAMILQAQNSYYDAQQLLEGALEIYVASFGEGHHQTAKIQADLAGVLKQVGQPERARELYAQALATYIRTRGARHPHTIKTQNNLAAHLTELGLFAEAAPVAREVLVARLELLGSDDPQIATAHNNLAFVLHRIGEYDEARPHLEEAHRIWRTAFGPDHPSTAHGLLNRAFLEADAGQLDVAWEMLREAVDEGERRDWRLLGSQTEAERFRFLGKLRRRLDVQLSLAALVGDPLIERVAYEAVLGWKGRISRSLLASHEQLASGLSDEQLALVDELRETQTELSKLVHNKASGEREAYEARMEELLGERTRLELELHRSSTTTEVRMTHDELRGRLPDGVAVVDFLVHDVYVPATHDGTPAGQFGVWGEEHLSVWVTRWDSEDLVRVDLGPAAAMGASVRAFLEDLVVRRGVSTAPEVGSADAQTAPDLDALLWSKIEPHVAGAGVLVISPDSFVGTLPFETIGRSDGTYLIEQYGFVYQQDISAIASGGVDVGPSARALLAVGGVDFRKREGGEPAPKANGDAPRVGRVRGSYWASLPATEYESQVVTDIHTDSAGDEAERLLLQGAAPTEERLKAELPRFNVLHLATHGFFHEEGMPSMWEEVKTEGRVDVRLPEEEERLFGMHPGLLSGIVCAGASRPSPAVEDDGYLTAEEVAWLDLSGVDLVVLSACDTALGRKESGEGMIGLRRAFRSAGADTVISSLWSVKDESTGELMQNFYENLWFEGMGTLEALRTAQLQMLMQNRAASGTGVPSTWGAFVLSGDWR